MLVVEPSVSSAESNEVMVFAKPLNHNDITRQLLTAGHAEGLSIEALAVKYQMTAQNVRDILHR